MGEILEGFLQDQVEILKKKVAKLEEEWKIAQNLYQESELKLQHEIENRNKLEAENKRLKSEAVDAQEHLEEYHTDLAQMRRERDALKEQVERLTDTLKFYSVSDHYPLAIMEVKHFEAVIDGGEKAREALAARASKEEKKAWAKKMFLKIRK